MNQPLEPRPNVGTIGAEPTELRRFARGDRIRLRTRNKILRAARDLFTGGGYVDCSVSDIADRAGVSRASFYVHFASKQELLTVLVERALEFQARSVRNLVLSREDPESSLREWITRSVSKLQDNAAGLSLYHFAVSLDPVTATKGFSESERTTLSLARNNAAFRVFNEQGELNESRFIGLRLLVTCLDQFAAAIVFGAWPHQQQLAIDVLTRRFLSFMYSD